MGVISLVDILNALQQPHVIVVNQFGPNSESFDTFFGAMTRDGRGYTPDGAPRIEFVQDARSYGPWPRDQAVIDRTGCMWISQANQHKLKPVFSSLDKYYGIQQNEAPVSFAGGNLMSCGDVVFCPDRIDTTDLSAFIDGPFIQVPSPPEPVPFHLDLLMMPVSDSTIVVGDDGLTRIILSTLTAEELATVVARWSTEYAVSANNVEMLTKEKRLMFQRIPEPPLIMWRFLKEKLQNLVRLQKPEVMRQLVDGHPLFDLDDRIAATLQGRGYRVVRVPFWPGEMTTGRESNEPLLPMICYPNCVVWDKGILMPTYGIPALDNLARRVLEHETRKEVFDVRGGALLGFGSSGPHCLTLEFRQMSDGS